MSIIKDRNFREQEHRNTVSELISSCSEEETQNDMKDAAHIFRQLRTSLLLSLDQMKHIHNDFGWEDDIMLISLRDIIKSVRVEEICWHEMLSSQCEFYNNEGA